MVNAAPAVVLAGADTEMGDCRDGRADQIGDDMVGNRRAPAGDEIIARAGRVRGLSRAAAGRHIVEVGSREFVEIGNVWVPPSSEPRPARARPWSAIAIRAAHCGAASLVPPNCDQGAVVPLLYES